MTNINLYLDNTDKKLKTYQIDELITNIDKARMSLIKYINPFYLNSKYKIIVKNRINGEKKYSEIDMIFENSIELNREFLIKELLA